MIDFTSTEFQFISLDNEYFIGEVKCEGDYTDWTSQKTIKDGWGLFRGLTNETYKGYDGPLPRLDGDTSTFEEFLIFWRGIPVTDMTYEELSLLMRLETRDKVIEKIL